jgi:hypothetical protein
MKETAKLLPKTAWSHAEAMAAKQRRTAAMSDLDNRPMTDEMPPELKLVLAKEYQYTNLDFGQF